MIFACGRDLAAVAGVALGQDEALLGGPGGDAVQRRASAGRLERAAQRLAVEGHDAGAVCPGGGIGPGPGSVVAPGAGEGDHEAAEGGFEGCGVEGLEHPAEGVVAGRAVGEADEATQHGQLGPREGGDVDAGPGAAQRGRQRDQQDLVQRVPRVGRPRIRHPRQERLHLTHRDLPPSGSLNAAPSHQSEGERHPYAMALPSQAWVITRNLPEIRS